jgi:DNA replication protein DnaC
VISDIVDVNAALAESLSELHLPTVKRVYEDAARQAQRETLSYERYLLDLVTREYGDRRQKRIQRLLRQSRIPAEKALSNFNLKRLPPKVALLAKSLIEGEVLDRLSRFIKKLGHFEGLIIDDLGYAQQSREEMEVLFTLLAERYERGNVLISSNLPFSKWEGIFKDPMTTAAAIDRLVHHCVILELNIPSYRVEQAKKAKEEAS